MTEARTVTTTPTELTGLTAGESYALQNVTPDATVFWASAPTEPDRTDPAHQIPPFGWMRMEASGDPAWVWTDRGTARLIVSEAT